MTAPARRAGLPTGVLGVLAVVAVAALPPAQASRERRTVASEGRIVGGEDARIADVPFQAAWLLDDRLHCGACVIGVNWLLSAAHCFTRKNNTRGSVFRVGSPTAIWGGTVHLPAEFFQHPGWTEATKRMDLGLIRLQSHLRLGSDVMPIAIVDSQTRVNETTTLSVSGWGLTKFGDQSHAYGGSYILQRLLIRPVHHGRCYRAFYHAFKMAVTDGMLCAQAHRKGTCMGDSGGPLVIPGDDALPTRLLGMVSWGAGCANENFPNVFTDLRYPAHRQFIEAVLGTPLSQLESEATTVQTSVQ